MLDNGYLSKLHKKLNFPVFLGHHFKEGCPSNVRDGIDYASLFSKFCP